MLSLFLTMTNFVAIRDQYNRIEFRPRQIPSPGVATGGIWVNSRFKLSQGALWLLLTFSGAQTANAVATVFVNLFMLVLAHNLSGLILFNIGYFVPLTATFYVAAKIFHDKPPLLPYRIGLLLTMVFYATLLGLSHHANQLIFVLGFFYGVAQGFYWFGFNLMTFDTIDPMLRMRFFGMSGAINSVTGIVAPLFSGFVISTLPGLGGYLIVFAAALALYSAAFVLSQGVPKGPPMQLRPVMDSWHIITERPKWAAIIKTVVVRGTREGIANLAGLFLIFVATHNAAYVGVYTALNALARMTSSLLITRHVRHGRQIAFMTTGIAGVSGAGMLLLAGQTWPWILAYGVLFGLSLPFYMVPSENIPLSIMDQDPEITQRRVSYTLSREVALNIGRLFTLALLALGTLWLTPRVMIIGLIILTSVAQFWNVPVMHAMVPRTRDAVATSKK